jgi:hypothetical protein
MDLLRLVVALLVVLLCALVQGQKINVHIVAHTHDDVGWLKTVDEYYYGANNSIQDAGVQYILDSVIPALLQNPERKFIYVEIGFFYRWWNEQSDQMKNIVRDLVATGRLEFINGGWCMNDEANTHYADIIDQMTEGHLFLFNEFGVRPTIGWHIDPFGHASTQATLFAMMGFNAFFFARIDYQDHDLRNATRELEFVWRGSQSLGKEAQIFTSVLYDGYGPPDGFAFEWSAPPIQDDPRLFNVNIKQRADTFVREMRRRIVSFKTSHILIPFGSDFQYQNANVNFKNMDKLIKYINSHPEYGVEMRYSTPSLYVKAVHEESQRSGVVWSVKTDDLFPYADGPHSYWTGYFTSRPALKGYVRTNSNLLHASEKLFTTARGVLGDEVVTRSNLEALDSLAQAMGVAQHHDAVAGTEKQHVAYDYAERLAIGATNALKVSADMIGKMIDTKKAGLPTFMDCPYLNVSVCAPLVLLAKRQSIPIIAYNPIAWHRTQFVSLPSPISNVEVINSQGQKVPIQVEANMDVAGIFTVIFSMDLPPMGYASYVIQPASSTANEQIVTKTETLVDSWKLPAAGFSIENEFLRVDFLNSTGRIGAIYNKQYMFTIYLDQSLQWYNGSAGNNKLSDQASGAYIFRPNRSETFNFTQSNIPAHVSVTRGPLRQQIRQVWTNWMYQTVNLYAGFPYVEFVYSVGPIDISDHRGKEVITRYTTNMRTGETWYTDSEGGEMQYRKHNYRPTWKLNVTEPVSCNYFPINTAAFLRDTVHDTQFTVVNDRSQGCGSVEDGELEVMLHRRLLHDDSRGVGEPLNESEPIRTVHQIFVDKPQNSARLQRPAALNINNFPTLLFGVGFSGNANQWFSTYQTQFAPLAAALPPNVHLLNLRTLDTGEVLLRLHHIYGIGEDAVYSDVAKVDLQNLFKNLRITKISEMSLSANMLKSEMHRYDWNTASVSSSKIPVEEGNDDVESRSMERIRDYRYKPVTLDSMVVELKPMDIRTFIVRFDQQK